jgi:superfamily II DNA or RNA helicase
MSYPLWPHQSEAIKAILDASKEGRNRALLVMPTGTGKTRTFCEFATEFGGPVLVMVHRDELLLQTEAALREVNPELRVEILNGKKGPGLQAPVCLVTVQRLTRRLGDFPADHFRLVVIDEAHHVPAPSWGRVVDHFTPELLLGCTATPKRLDGQDPGDWFGVPVFDYPLGRAMDDRVLVPLRQKAHFTDTSLDGLGKGQGDFGDKALSKLVNTADRNQGVVDAYQAYAKGRRTLVFAVDLNHVEQIRLAFESSGIRAAKVTGEMLPEERRGVLGGFRRGDFEVLVGCEVLTEGYDERSIGCVIMARPTKSIARYQQCVGRGLRTDPGSEKDDCLVIDIRDRTNFHRLATASLLFGPEVIDCDSLDVRQAVAHESARIEVRPLVPTPGKAARWSAGEDVPWPCIPDLSEYSPDPAKKWEQQPATQKQHKALKGFGMEARRPLKKGEASYLIQACKELDEAHPTPATSGQEWILRKSGLWVEGMSKREATGLIIRQRNWGKTT